MATRKLTRSELGLDFQISRWNILIRISLPRLVIKSGKLFVWTILQCQAQEVTLLVFAWRSICISRCCLNIDYAGESWKG
ncbi:hypothetical protein LINPERHAP2_LOCUS15185 [Linum perenne]